MRFLLFFLLVCVPAVQTRAQSTPALDQKVAFEVSIANNQREFHVGETIPLRLSFSSPVKGRYQINMAQYDRSGRMNYEHFAVMPAEGTVDPLPIYTGSMGGLTNFKFLTSTPWTLNLNLNEWVRFTHAGEYKLIINSNRVGVRDRTNPFGASPVTVSSNELTLKILPADRAWQKRILNEAVAALEARAPTSGQQMTQEDTASRRKALETLRFLGTADATRELAKRLRDEDSGGLDYLCQLGLIASPERAVARLALEEALADPDRPINSTFLYTLRMVRSDSTATDAERLEVQQKIIEELILALPNKRGKALSISLSTAVHEAWNGNALPQQTTDRLVNQLLSMFDQLPLNEQNNLLTYGWDQIKNPAMLPLLRRYAQSYRDFPEMRESNAYDSLQLSASALERWYELDPVAARPAIIKEITRPRPRFDARVLGILPDETLPEVDFVLAEHFMASDDLDASSHLASLIARYATAAILPQVTERLDAHNGKWACSIQSPILAYVLRVSPALARTRIEGALAARGKNFSACNHELFQAVSAIRYDPVLEEIAVHSLDDANPEVAMTAATMLGQYGSPAAEAALWRRFTSWSEQWTRHESELDLAPGDRSNDRIYQLGLGQNLIQAITTGQSWLSDKNKLQRLAGQTAVRRLHQQLDNYLKIWDDQPLTVFFNSTPTGFEALIAQYELHTIAALKEKLAQFPAGTKFFLSTSQTRTTANDEALAELRAFLSAHGMSVAGEKRAS